MTQNSYIITTKYEKIKTHTFDDDIFEANVLYNVHCTF